MPQLDRFLSVLVNNRAESLQLHENGPAIVRKDGTDRPVTAQPLSAQQLLMLVREIAPPDAVQQLSAGTAATFRYSSSDGVFVARVTQTDGKWQAVISPEGTGSSAAVAAAPAAAVAAPTTTANVAAVPAAAPAPVKASAGAISVLAERRETARADIDHLLRLMVEKNASDLHLRCGEPPVLRTHGEMVRVEGKPVLESEELEMMLASIMPDRNKKEFAEANDTDYAYEIEGVARFRANALRDRKGAAAVFRVIPATVVSVEQMGITQEVQNLCYLTKGLVLVTGPTGSGKSTTLCSLIDLVNRSRSDHVITIEDPIEFVHPNKKCIITQRQVGVHTTSFKSALRAALREDPDIILVGELRDLETVSIAIETAETGHLVFGTLHTTTAAGTIDRIIDQFPADRQEQIRVMLAESLKGVISQTLCKKIGGGRVAAREILLTIPAVSNLVREGKTFQIPSVMQTSKRLGMCTLNDALIDLVDQKLVEPKEAYMKAVEKQGFAMALKSRGHDVGFLEGDGHAPAAAAPAAGPPAGKGDPGSAKPGAAGRPAAGAAAKR
ncbi:MAG TPA: type IV pilus twitching motility protein PilT [Gaiellaceae bacterium]|nr:type IV pilus twitching motility protein PilT [Gaiellaceae bacterium]